MGKRICLFSLASHDLYFWHGISVDEMLLLAYIKYTLWQGTWQQNDHNNSNSNNNIEYQASHEASKQEEVGKLNIVVCACLCVWFMTRWCKKTLIHTQYNWCIYWVRALTHSYNIIQYVRTDSVPLSHSIDLYLFEVTVETKTNTNRKRRVFENHTERKRGNRIAKMLQ